VKRPAVFALGITTLVAALLLFSSAALEPAQAGVQHKKVPPAQGEQEEEETPSPLERPACAYCKKPLLKSFVVAGDKKYHKECYEDHIALRCALCGKIVEGRYSYDFWGNVYHESHEADVPRCQYCLRFISERVTGGGVEYPDGRHVCNICRRTAVDDPGAAAALLEEVRGRLERLGLSTRGEEIPVSLVDLREMHRISGSRSHTLRGYTEHQETRITPGEVESYRSRIYLLEGMPRMEAMATLAHELTHIWAFLKGRKEGGGAFVEGSCNYASSLVVMEYPGKESEFVVNTLSENADPVYGEGFRRVRRLAEERGRGAWLDRLRGKEAFPPGY